MSDNPEVSDNLEDRDVDTQDIDLELDADAPDVDADGDGEITSLEAELAERTEDLQRVTAEYANYRRRTERDRAGIVETAKASVITELLPILDDLDLAAQHGDLESGPLKSVSDKFHAVLNKFSVTVVGEEGDAFDHEKHEAVQDLSSGEEKVLGTVLRHGDQMDDRLIRTAMVIIADPS